MFDEFSRRRAGVLGGVLLVAGFHAAALDVFTKPLAVFGSGLLTDVAAAPATGRIAIGSEYGVHFLDSPTRFITPDILPAGKRVSALAWTPDGEELLIGDGHGTLERWHVASGLRVAAHTTDLGTIRELVLSADGGAVFVASALGGRLQRYRADDFAGPLEFTGHTAPITRICVTPDGQRVITTGLDDKLRVWNAATGEMLHQLMPFGADSSAARAAVSAVAVLPDSRTALLGSSTLRAPSLALWDIESGQEIAPLNALIDDVTAAEIAPSGQTAYVQNAAGAITLWDLVTRHPIGTTYLPLRGNFVVLGERTLLGHESHAVTRYDLSAEPLGLLRQSSDSDWSMALTARYTPDGARIVTADARGLRTWERERLIELAAITSPFTPPATPRLVEVSADGTQALSSHSSILSWHDLASGAVTRRYVTPQVVIAAAVTPDQSTVLAASITDMRVYRNDPSLLLRTIPSPTGYIHSLHAVGNTRTALLGTSSPGAFLMDFDSGAVVRTLYHGATLTRSAVSADGRVAATVAAIPSHQIKIWDVQTGLVLNELSLPEPVTAAALSPDGGLIAFGFYNSTSGLGGTRFIDLRSGETVLELERSASELQFALQDGRLLMKERGGRYSELVMGMPPTIVATFAPLTNSPSTRTPLVPLPSGAGVVFSPGGGGVMILERGRPEARQLLSPAAGVNYALTISPDGAWLGTGGTSRVFHIWDAATLTSDREITTSGTILSAAFLPDRQSVLLSVNSGGGVPAGIRRVALADGATLSDYPVLGDIIGTSADGGHFVSFYFNRLDFVNVVTRAGTSRFPIYGLRGLLFSRDSGRLMVYSSPPSESGRSAAEFLFPFGGGTTYAWRFDSYADRFDAVGVMPGDQRLLALRVRREPAPWPTSIELLNGGPDAVERRYMSAPQLIVGAQNARRFVTYKPGLIELWALDRRTGDANCDGAVDFNDIAPFVTALLGSSAYSAAYPTCDWSLSDADGDGQVDFADMDAFVACLVREECAGQK